jgi:hypothetical protein
VNRLDFWMLLGSVLLALFGLWTALGSAERRVRRLAGARVKVGVVRGRAYVDVDGVRVGFDTWQDALEITLGLQAATCVRAIAAGATPEQVKAVLVAQTDQLTARLQDRAAPEWNQEAREQ